MRTATSRLKLFEPRRLTEALRLLRDEGPLVPLAGGTDLYVALNFGTLGAQRFLDLWRLEELRGVKLRGRSPARATLVIGALTTYTELIESSLVRRRLPMLVDAARLVGGVQVQNRGTLGGNIANGSPAGDTLPVLAAADAIVVLAAAGRRRRVPFNEFYTGYRASVMRPDELIVAIEVPPVGGQQWFRKVGTRAAQAISKIVFAGTWEPGRVRVALGSVAPTVIRAHRTEAALAAGLPLEAAQRLLQTEIAPIEDVRSTVAYRRRVAGNLLAQFWRESA